jgi:hypothetical protein
MIIDTELSHPARVGLANVVVGGLALLIGIPEVPRSNLRLETGYSESDFVVFFSTSRQIPLASRSFPIYSLITI